MSDAEIIRTVRWIRRLWRQPHRPLFQAVASGLILRMEDAGVTEADIDRLGLL